jgi:MoxR-like ATPase
MMNFYIPETRETISALHKPVVIITSNAEKELPDAFLRRCVFHYIDFPDEKMMREIINVHFKDLEERLISSALECFYRLRGISGLMKKPSTSELLDWLAALIRGGVKPEKLTKEIPYLGVLLKKNEDFARLRQVTKGNKESSMPPNLAFF